MLPTNFESFPYFFTEEEFTLLKGSPLPAHIKELKDGLKNVYDAVC